MKILLISPKYNAHIIAPHLGLGYLSSSLKKDGHQVLVMDGLREEIQYDPKDWDLVGITAMSTYFPEAVAEAKRAKSYGLKTIIGGPHTIAIPRQSLIDAAADYACVGEGEITLRQLASELPLSEVEGLLYWENGEIKQSSPKQFHKQIDDFGQPDWNSIDPRSYPFAPHGMIARAFPLAPIITSRGCPYRCTYCSAPITAGKGMRYRDPVQVVDEIEMLIKNYGVREIQIEDDNFTIKRSHTVAICEEILKRNIKVFWSLPNGVRIDRLDRELIRLMKRSGCYLMALGIESANQRILDMVKKRLNQKIVKDMVQEVVDAGIEAWGFFMVGFPGETREEILNTINFGLTLPLTRAQFTKTTPLPGTEMYDIWVQDYAGGEQIDWATFNYYQFSADWSQVTPSELANLQKWGHFRFYSRPSRFFNIIRHLRLDQYRTAFKRLFNLSKNSNLEQLQ
ncbi:MAG: radical SAM protein [SAR324 cluster bacterium]|nr:radical SAM protein [SAR324 cluster bacterium]